MIILITVAAVAIIWAAVIPLVKDNLEGGTTCFNAAQAVAIEQAFTCIDTNGDVDVQISRASGSDVELDSVNILFNDDEGTGVTIGIVETDLPTEGGKKIKTITNADIDKAGIGGNVVSIAIAPVVAIGNSVEPCEASAPVVLQACTVA